MRGFRQSLLEAKSPYPALAPAKVVGELVAQGPLDLLGEQLAVMAEVAFERVAVDHDAVLEAVTSDAVTEILAVGPVLAAQLGDDHGDRLQQALEFLRQGIDRVRHQGFELIHLESVPNIHYVRRPGTTGPPMKPTRGMQEMNDVHAGVTNKLRVAGASLAIGAVLAGGFVWSGCGSSKSSSDTTSQESTGNVQEQIEEGVKKAEKGVEEGTESAQKGLEKAKKELQGSKGSAKKGIEEGVEKAEKGIEEGKAQAEKGVEEAKSYAEKYAP